MDKIRHTFSQRISEVRFNLKLVESMELYSKFVSGPKQEIYSPEFINTCKSSIVIMTYSCIEYALRYCIVRIREEIMSRKLAVQELHIHWRQDFIQSKVLQSMREGSNHNERIREISILVDEIAKWTPREITKIYGSNIGNSELLSLVKKPGISWSPPRESRNGIDLEYIRLTRNALSHGDESFIEKGSEIVLTDLLEKVSRIEIIILSFFDAIDIYISANSYACL